MAADPGVQSVIGKCVAVCFIALALTACAESNDVSSVPNAPGYPKADGPGEIMQADEARAATAIGDAIEIGLTRRGQGPKKCRQGRRIRATKTVRP